MSFFYEIFRKMDFDFNLKYLPKLLYKVFCTPVYPRNCPHSTSSYTQSKKQKYLITLPNEELFAFAGIFTEWTDFNNEKIHSYSIITTQANDLMSEIHNTKQRMPVILKKEGEQQWLHGENYEDFKYPYSCNLVAKPLNNDYEQLNLF